MILQYHHVSDESAASTSISPRLFDQQMQYLEDHSYNIWPLPRLIESLHNNRSIPDRVVVITFDDAYSSVYENAYPLLKKRNWPFTIFVATDTIGEQPTTFMSWTQLKKLALHGVTIANHTSSHTHLVRHIKSETSAQWKQRVQQEILNAEQAIKNKIGISVKLLAYPYGEYTEALKTLVSDLGYVAFGQQSGAVGSAHHRAALPRFPMTNFYGEISQFAIKVASLPMSATSIEPSRHLIRDSNILANGLKLRFPALNLDPNKLACYLSGQGKIETQVTTLNEHLQVNIARAIKLQPGRARLNCTVPAKDPNNTDRFYWFSHSWLRTMPNGDWYLEP